MRYEVTSSHVFHDKNAQAIVNVYNTRPYKSFQLNTILYKQNIIINFCINIPYKKKSEVVTTELKSPHLQPPSASNTLHFPKSKKWLTAATVFRYVTLNLSHT